MTETVKEVKRSNAEIAQQIATEYNIGYNTVVSILRKADELRFEDLVRLRPVNFYGLTTIDAEERENGVVTVRSRTSSTLASRIADSRAEKGLYKEGDSL